MTPFLTIFYGSLLTAIFLLIFKKAPVSSEKNTEKHSGWYLINIHAIDAFFRKTFLVHIKPRIVKISLFTLKITQNHLQSIRRHIRNLIKRLSEIEDKNVTKRHHRSV